MKLLPEDSTQLKISSDDHGDIRQKEETKPQASVSFAPEEDNITHESMSRSEYSQTEIQACFYSVSEYMAMKREALKTLHLNRTSSLSPQDPEYTMRGLECRTRECSNNRRFVRYNAAAAVFKEQAKNSDPEAISDAYHAVSWHSMYDAHTQALADEQDAQALLVFERQPKFFALQRSSSSKRRSNVLSSIISIGEPEPLPVAPASSIFLGMDCKLQHLHSTSSSSNSFNLSSFFNDLSIGVAAA